MTEKNKMNLRNSQMIIATMKSLRYIFKKVLDQNKEY